MNATFTKCRALVVGLAMFVVALAPSRAGEAATLIHAHALDYSTDGKQLKASETTHRNFIAGDAKQIEKLLRRHPELFNAEPMIVLHRIRDVPPSTDPTAPATAVPPVPGQ